MWRRKRGARNTKQKGCHLALEIDDWLAGVKIGGNRNFFAWSNGRSHWSFTVTISVHMLCQTRTFSSPLIFCSPLLNWFISLYSTFRRGSVGTNMLVAFLYFQYATTSFNRLSFSLSNNGIPLTRVIKKVTNMGLKTARRDIQCDMIGAGLSNAAEKALEQTR